MPLHIICAKITFISNTYILFKDRFPLSPWGLLVITRNPLLFSHYRDRLVPLGRGAQAEQGVGRGVILAPILYRLGRNLDRECIFGIHTFIHRQRNRAGRACHTGHIAIEHLGTLGAIHRDIRTRCPLPRLGGHAG